MYVKNLRMLGFKTFAARTEFQFKPGITTILGPNGAGKSNIFDAIVWVLGEHNVRSIRGRRMEEVVFHGSAKKKPLGFAQVELTFDNEDGFFPVPHSEVSLQRRYYRSGESEFFINNESCRLRDIQNLLLDTGLGKLNYSIVSQGDVEYIINLSPVNRRVIFDEAAGINKYRIEKRKTLQKIADTDANVSRITDIVTELGERLGPLSIQAEKARRYEEIASELENLKLSVLVNDMRRLAGSLEQHAREQKQLEEEAAGFGRRIAEKTVAREELRKKLFEAQTEAEGVRDRQNQVLHEIARADEAARFSARMIENLRQQLDAEGARLDAEGARRRELHDAASELKRQAEALETETAVMEEEESGIRLREEEKLPKEEKAAREALKLKREALSRLREREQSLSGEIGAMRTETLFLELTVEEREKRRAETEREVERVAEEVSSLKDELKRRRRALEEGALKSDGRRSRLAELRERLKGLTAAAAENVKRMSAARTGLEVAGARLEEARMRTGAGADPGEWIPALEKTDVPRLRQLVRVREGRGEIVRNVLGPLLEAPVVSSVEGVNRVYLVRGREVTFIVLPAVEPPDGERAGAIRSEPGVIGTMTDFVEPLPDAPPALRHFLDRIAVVADTDAVPGLMGLSHTGFSIRTRDGSAVIEQGTLRLGGDRESIEELEDRVVELEEEVRKLEEETGRIDAESVQAEAEMTRLSQEEAKGAEAAERLRADEARHEARLEGVEERGRALREGVEREAALARSETERRAVLEREAARLEGELSRARAEIRSLEAEARGMEGALSGGTDAAATREAYAMDLKMRIRESRASLAGVRKNLSLHESELRRVEAGLERIGETVERLRKERDEESVKRGAALEALEGLRKRRDGMEALFREKMDEMTAVRASVAALDGEVERLRAAEGEARQNLLQLEIKRARSETMLEETRRTFEQEYPGMSEEEAFKRAEGIKHGDKSRFRELKAEMQALLPVNQLAIEEYEEAKNRHDFLTGQLEDLKATRRELLEMVAHFDELCRENFLTTFEQVNRKFQETFQEIFNGGESRVFLTDESDPLESGVDISVQIPGKRMRSLQLLSGGEKALCALTLIFAILKVKPSPFYLLDEVDAGLDDQNIQKFKTMLAKYSSEAQFFVITHNKGTLEGADHYYGITMNEEEGESRVLSVSLS
ncbi:MAG: chromosome segregation protein SMC [bacterium]